MIYKLNDKIITSDEVKILIDDLAEFPLDKKDYLITIEQRKKKYIETLNEEKQLKIADALTIYAIDK